MIEIFILIWFWAHLAKKAELRSRARSWAWLGVGMWIGGEFTGATIGALLAGNPAGVYMFALLGALAGAADPVHRKWPGCRPA